MRSLILLVLLALPCSARAQTAWSDHGRWWFGGDLGLALGKYSRRVPVPEARGRRSTGANLNVSAMFVGDGPLGLGGHVNATLQRVDQVELSGRVLTMDVGPDAFARLSFRKLELTLRVPLGLSTGRLNWVRTESEALIDARVTNDLGFGFHVAPLAGAVVWLTDWVGLRLETGVWLRWMRFDEGKTQEYPGESELRTLRGEVAHRSVAWALSLGIVRRLNPKSLPDEDGPPLPTPDYNYMRGSGL